MSSYHSPNPKPKPKPNPKPKPKPKPKPNPNQVDEFQLVGFHPDHQFMNEAAVTVSPP